MVHRLYEKIIAEQMRLDNRIIIIYGPRQVGKTTLAREIARLYKGATHFFDLENSEDLSRLTDPLFALKALKGLVIIDEVPYAVWMVCKGCSATNL